MIALIATALLSASDGQPNLVVQSILVTPSPPSVGHTATIIADLKNLGPGTVDSLWCYGGDIRVRFDLDGNQVGLETLACGLDPNESDPESISFVFREPGTHSLRVVVDPENDFSEANELDNALTIPVTVGLPALTIGASVPAVGAPGEHAIPVAVTVRNDSGAELEHVWISLSFDDQPAIDLGWSQDADLDPGETATFSGLAALGNTADDIAFAPGKHQWVVHVFGGALPPSSGAYDLAEPVTFPIEVVDTVSITDANVVVPTVAPAQPPYGAATTVTAARLAAGGAEYDAVLAFTLPVDPTADGSTAILEALASADVFDAAGQPVCDAALRRDVLRGLLIWRDLIAEHSWYQSTFVAVQEGLTWYETEIHLKIAYFITEPFVILSELMNDLLSAGKELALWLGEKVGFDSATEASVGDETLKAVLRITKGYEALDDGVRGLMKLSPLLSGQPYLSDHVVTERLLMAIDADGADLDSAATLIHDVIAQTSPQAYTSFGEILTKELVLKAIKKTLVKGVKGVLWTAVKHGFTGYFVAQLTAKTAVQVALGEGSHALLAGLTTAGIAKGIASMGLTLLIDASIAYLSYTGTYVNNIRGKGGLCESGRVVAASVPWTHTSYVLDGSAGPLDVEQVERTFLSHAALFELYGFVNADLATLKKLAFAPSQAKTLQAEAASMFDVAAGQRDFVVAVEAALATAPSPACTDAPVAAPVAEYRAPPADHEAPAAVTPEPTTRWSKREAASPPLPPNAPRGPVVLPVRDRTDVTPDAGSDSTASPAAAASGCGVGGTSTPAAAWLGLAFGVALLVRRRNRVTPNRRREEPANRP